jgi:hypothetical protein
MVRLNPKPETRKKPEIPGRKTKRWRTGFACQVFVFRISAIGLLLAARSRRRSGSDLGFWFSAEKSVLEAKAAAIFLT